MKKTDADFVRLAIRQAERAREKGNHPFGAVLTNEKGEILLAAENSVVSHRDAIAHAEINLIRAATQQFSPAELVSCSVYTNAEPCPMCASAMVWANIRRVVFGLGMEQLYAAFGDVGDAPTLKMESRKIFNVAPWPIEVIGPMLEDEALITHQGFWQTL